ncbi:MAG: hypothetical protein M3265_00885, partial [Actinomycetota bacterium]|nr:hypothetical protein [Actinomycetota bacterium]
MRAALWSCRVPTFAGERSLGAFTARGVLAFVRRFGLGADARRVGCRIQTLVRRYVTLGETACSLPLAQAFEHAAATPKTIVVAARAFHGYGRGSCTAARVP